jgi:predicted nicotinamide N-methyase
VKSTGLEAVEESLRRRFRVVTTDVKVGRRRVSILHPESAEDLIDEREFDRDERLPYWAELWPSARVLAEQVLGMEAAGRTLLELGCGSGLVSTCASLAGFDVVASDYYEDALRFARVNAVRNGATAPRGLVLDWRRLPTDLPTFDVVLASDVLYERSYGPIVARAIGAALADRGHAFVADPGRVGREEFIRTLKDSGLRVAKRTELPFVEGRVRQTIAVFDIRRSPVPK